MPYIQQTPFRFHLVDLMKVLNTTPEVISNFLMGQKATMLKFNEGEGTWNPLQIMDHLILAEQTLWIARAKIILSNKRGKKPFQAFDRLPKKTTKNTTSINMLCEEFIKLRRDNIKTLESWNLDNKKLSKTGIHPEFGEVTLRQLLTTWMVHDLGHQIQILRVTAKQFTAAVGPWVKYISLFK